MVTCNKCGNVLNPGAKFCTKCGNPVASSQDNRILSSGDVCPQCNTPLKPGAKFCTSCGFKVLHQGPAPSTIVPTGLKGGFADDARAIVNTSTGVQQDRDISNKQNAGVNQQSTDQALIRAEHEAERARDRRSQEAVAGVDVVRGCVIWNIQPGEIARRIKESELAEVEKLRGIIVQEGCSALIFANGQLVSTLSSGAYRFYKSDEEENAALKAAVEKVKKELDEKERKALAEKRAADPKFLENGILGEVKRGMRWVGRLIFGEQKNEKKDVVEKRKMEYARLLSSATALPVMSVYIVSDRNISLTFGGTVIADGGVSFNPYTISAGLFDVQIAVSLQVKVSDIHAVAANYLADQQSLTTNSIFQLLNQGIESQLSQSLRNVNYQQYGLSENEVSILKDQIQQYINAQLYGIECVKVLQITDKSVDFERFRAVERELYCAEKELSYLQRTGEFRNRLAIETNKQTIDTATTEEELRYALMQVNKDGLLHDDEMDAFRLMLDAQKRLREAKSQEEEYEALLDIKRSRLVKDDEMEALQDALAHNKIQRDSVTEIMRIQHQQSVDDARLSAEWAIGDKKQDHDWEREDLQRRRNWGIEDEQREREWAMEEREYNRDFARKKQEDEYEWQQTLRKEQLRSENERVEYERRRQDKFDDVDILERKQQGAMAMMQAMKEAELRELQEKNRAQMHRDTVEAQMSAEAIAAKQISQLDAAGQIALSQALGSEKQNELLLKQQSEQAALYQQMLQMQQMQGTQNQEMMMRMAQMMQQGMMGIGQQQQQMQQQRYDDQLQRANEYRQDAYRNQDRLDANTAAAMNNMSQIGTAAASNLYTQNTNVNLQHMQNIPQQPQTPSVKVCPRCNTTLNAEEVFCGECGFDFRVM